MMIQLTTVALALLCYSTTATATITYDDYPSSDSDAAAASKLRGGGIRSSAPAQQDDQAKTVTLTQPQHLTMDQEEAAN